MVANNINFYNDIIKATVRVMKKRGWTCMSGDNIYNPFYRWADGNHGEWNKDIHHESEHPKHGLIIHRGFFFNSFAENTKGINNKELEKKWEKDKQKYDQFIIEILINNIRDVMDVHGRYRMVISFSSEPYKHVDMDKNKSLKTYMIFNNE